MIRYLRCFVIAIYVKRVKEGIIMNECIPISWFICTKYVHISPITYFRGRDAIHVKSKITLAMIINNLRMIINIHIHSGIWLYEWQYTRVSNQQLSHDVFDGEPKSGKCTLDDTVFMIFRNRDICQDGARHDNECMYSNFLIYLYKICTYFIS